MATGSVWSNVTTGLSMSCTTSARHTSIRQTIMFSAVKATQTLPLVVLMALSACPLVMNVAKPNPFRVPEAFCLLAGQKSSFMQNCKRFCEAVKQLNLAESKQQVRQKYLQSFWAEKDPRQNSHQLQELLSGLLASPTAAPLAALAQRRHHQEVHARSHCRRHYKTSCIRRGGEEKRFSAIITGAS